MRINKLLNIFILICFCCTFAYARNASDYSRSVINDNCSGDVDIWTNSGSSIAHSFSSGEMTVTESSSSSRFIYSSTAVKTDFYYEIKFKYTSWSGSPSIIQIIDSVGNPIIEVDVITSDGSLKVLENGSYKDTTVDLSLNTTYTIKVWGNATENKWYLEIGGNTYGSYTKSSSTAENNGTVERIGGGTSASQWVMIVDYVIVKDTYSPAPVNTCTCPAKNTNWVVKMANKCEITANCNIGSGTVKFNGAGNFTIGTGIILNTTLPIFNYTTAPFKFNMRASSRWYVR
jgi:hypothetical protein